MDCNRDEGTAAHAGHLPGPFRIDRDLWSPERFWTSNVLYTLVWAGSGWMWNRAWGPYALATLEHLDVESPIRKNADRYMEISKEDVENPEHALSKVHEALSTHPLIAVPWPVLVERAWKLQPKKVALTCGDQTITYEEFVAYAGIVQRMCMRTVERGAHVLVTFSDSPCSRLTWAVVMYALAASGVPFSLMDRRTLTNAPARERMLERWVPKVWICCDREAHSAPVGGMASIPCRTDVALDFINKEVVVDG
ncbi:hypothetical protein Pmar_PMAR026670 [Perkinsus marinus ATCC 50983]|uniref:Uncharacterized protein n=1 Tax=Perkinsus marinus (strain ATCC 50983 / TXsc) TaxID=423536 RepID=C5LGX0_PERM5|nr:hypothetical protein Pmar_PMAR026670 [Perkinsus marinus ATCC 50983]EER04023.1 hypothetical protein Pmar_PMAR026670 [Perkinsus marinus ATCC 50983]|eukprot:XP_002772207.1 hypothetical protein Pmar_PMAR026670 [Perkinsus marinus ATCC 50983]